MPRHPLRSIGGLAASLVALAGMVGRFPIALAVVPGEQHVLAEQFLGDRGGALDGRFEVERGSGCSDAVYLHERTLGRICV